MATPSQSRCIEANCKEWAEPHSRLCMKHQEERKVNRNKASDMHRGSAKDRGYDAVWNKVSKMHLTKEPLCRRCLENKVIRDADLIDHISPIVVNSSRRLDPNNLQPLCYSCHSIKTMEDMKKYPEYFKPENAFDELFETATNKTIENERELR